MLRQRFITAAVFITLLVGGILFLPTFYFAVMIFPLLVIGAWEWAALIGWGGTRGARSAYVLVVVAAVWALGQLPIEIILAIGCVWWLIALLAVWRYPRGGAWWVRKETGALAGILVLAPTWLALVTLHGHDHLLVLFILVLTWLADIAAYFAGRRWGARTGRLAPRVSPGKTWAGVAGAALVIGLYAGVGGAWLFGAAATLLFVLLCWATLAFSILGDLLESLFKRQAGVKDSGTLLPGHGGLLDRIDSLTAAAPVFMLGLMLLGYLP